MEGARGGGSLVGVIAMVGRRGGGRRRKIMMIRRGGARKEIRKEGMAERRKGTGR